jgi:riboflavin synthase
MFTGIILAIGKIADMQQRGGDVRLKIHTGKLNLTDAQLGDSIAVNGVCLTAVELGKDYFCADVSNETLARTILKNSPINMPVNLELSLTPSSRMGGHIVSGHVDGIGKVISKQHDGRSIRFQIQAPAELAKYIAEKGSICINGISLTVNKVNGAIFDINIVPHTLQETTLGTTDIGMEVNLEVDLLARYLERLLQGNQSNKECGTITEDLLQKTGFMSSNKMR